MKSSVCLVILLVGLIPRNAVGKRKPSSIQSLEVSDSHKLMTYLMERIALVNPTGLVRPVLNSSETLHVSFGLALLGINNIDRVSGMAEFQVWERFAWRDSFMGWNPEDFGGISNTRAQMGRPIWTPNLILYNSAESPEACSEDMVGVLYSDGSIFYMHPTVRKVRCRIEEGGIFDKDVAHCSFKYGTRVWDGFNVDIDFYDGLESTDLSDFPSDNRYGILNSKAKKNVKFYPCCQEPYPDLTFRLEINLH